MNTSKRGNVWMRVGLMQLAALIGPTLYGQANLSDSFRARAEVFFNEGNNVKALEYYQKAFQAAFHKDVDRTANLCVDISTVYYTESKYEAATQKCWEGLKMLSSAAPDSLFFKCYSSLGEMYKKRYMADSSLFFFQKANALADSKPELLKQIPDYVLYSYNNQSRFYFLNEDYGQGIALFNKAIEVSKKLNKKDDAAILSNNIAEYYEILGDYSKAFQSRQSAVQTYSKKDISLCQMYSGLGWDAYLLNKTQLAITYFVKALTLLEQIKAKQQNPDYEAYTLNLLGNCYVKLADVRRAKSTFLTALSITERQKVMKGKVLADSYIGLGRTAEQTNQFSLALDYYEKARNACRNPLKKANKTILSAVLAPKPLFEATRSKAEVYAQLYEQSGKKEDLKKAVDTYTELIRLSEQIRINFPSPETKLFYSEKVFKSFEKAIHLTYQLYDQTHNPLYQNLLFSLIEYSRSAALRDALQELKIKPGTITPQLLYEEKTLQQQIAKLSNQIATERDSTKAVSQRQKMNDLELKRNTLLQTFEQKYPNYYRAKYTDKISTIKQLQQFLKPEELFVSYFWSKPYLYITGISNNSMTLRRQEINPDQLQAALDKLYRSLYTNPGLSTYTAQKYSVLVYDWFISPLQKELKSHPRLIIARDAVCNFLPFEVLESGKKKQDYVANQAAIRYAYSATTLLNSASLVQPRSSTLAVAPFESPLQSTATLGFQPLPASGEEARSIGDVTLVNQEATKARFLKEYPKHTVFYLATHAAIDNDNPNQSYIAFHPTAKPYQLYTNEIYSLDLSQSKLVVLGSCEGGSGLLHRGEGVLSLARALTYAGCPSVISTLWKAQDQSTAYLSKLTYQFIQEGLPLDIALQKARQTYWQSPVGRKYNHPYYWSNLVLIGHAAPLELSSSSRVPFYIIALCLLVGAVGGYAWKKRRQ